MNITEMSRDELIQFIADRQDTLDVDILKQALDRIDTLENAKKSEADQAIAAINDESFDDLPMEEQLQKLIKAAQLLNDEAKKNSIEL
jgi:ribosomal 50S subunit-associated protein YjgA (DUF615 family)